MFNSFSRIIRLFLNKLVLSYIVPPYLHKVDITNLKYDESRGCLYHGSVMFGASKDSRFYGSRKAPVYTFSLSILSAGGHWLSFSSVSEYYTDDLGGIFRGKFKKNAYADILSAMLQDAKENPERFHIF